MPHFLQTILDASDFPARWHCGIWTPLHGWVHIISDLAIWGAYTAIPLIILFYLLKRKEVAFPRVGWLFAAFIFFCGTGHLIEAGIFWWPAYRLSGVVKAGTAVASWATVAAVVPLIPQALQLPSLSSIIRRLEKEVADRTKAEELVREQNKDLETLLHIVSHDLREPVRYLVGLTSLLEETSQDGELDARTRDVLTRIAGGGKRLDALIANLQEYSRARRIDAVGKRVELNDVVEEAKVRLTGLIERRGVKLTIEETLPIVLADRTWACQAVYNLLNNAIKFTPADRTPEIEVRGISDTGHFAGIAVYDNGCGIDPNQRESIYELFRRGVGTEVEGTGTGLAIVAEVAARHGGRTWNEARPGGGSIFYLTFPRSR